MEYKIKQIEQKVYCENELKKITNQVIYKLTDRLKTYKDKKILKVNNSLMKVVSDDLKEILKNDFVINPFKVGDYAKINFIYVSCDTYGLSLKIGLNCNGGNYEDKSYYCFYYEKYFYLGEIREGVLTKIFNEFDLKPINLNEQISTFKRATELKEELDKVKDKLKPYSLRELI
jgi:hypothetical protein